MFKLLPLKPTAVFMGHNVRWHMHVYRNSMGS